MAKVKTGTKIEIIKEGRRIEITRKEDQLLVWFEIEDSLEGKSVKTPQQAVELFEILMRG